MKKRSKRKAKHESVAIISARFVLFLLLLPVGVLTLLYFGNIWILRALLFWFGIFILFALWHILAGSLIRVRSRISHDAPEKGTRIQIITQVQNRSFLPLMYGTILLLTPESPFQSDPHVFAFSMPPFSSRTFRTDVTCLCRGLYPVGPGRALRRDPFGFLSLPLRRATRQPLQVRVWPRLVSVPDLVHNRTIMEEQTSEKRDFTEDLTSVHHIRDWRDGDIPRKIHWKLTARTGSLMVKEFDGLAREEITLLLDIAAVPVPKEGLQAAARLRFEDALIESSYSIASDLLQSGRAIRLVTRPDRDTQLHGARVEDLNRFRNYLAYLRFDGSPGMLDLLLGDPAFLSGGGSLILFCGFPARSTVDLLKNLSMDGRAVLLVLAVSTSEEILSAAQAVLDLRRAGIVCLVADSDRGLQPFPLREDEPNE